MITLNRKYAIKNRNIGVAMLVTAVVFIVLSFVMGSVGYAEIVAIGAFVGGGINAMLNAGKVSKRYEKYFNEGSVKTIAELANELGLKEKTVLINLHTLAKNSDGRRLKKCENVKFEA